MADWIPVPEVLEVLVESKKHSWKSWSWMRNTKCKYISLRIDMRDGKCVIFNRDGKPITLDELKYQYPED